MALPVKTKIWQSSVNNAGGAGSGSNGTDLPVILLGVKNALKGFGFSPWTVRGSSNSVAAGMDGVDRWSATGDLVWTGNVTPVVHSWIVLYQAATGMHILFELAGVQPLREQCAVYMSLIGFTGGTTMARPTATDEIVVKAQGGAWTWDAFQSRRYHVLHSTDGLATYVLITGNNGFGPAVFGGLWMFAKLDGAPVGINPAVAAVTANAGSASAMTLGSWALRHPSGSGGLSCAAAVEAYDTGGGVTFATPAAANDISGERIVQRLRLFAVAADLEGDLGQMPDLMAIGLTTASGGGAPAGDHFGAYDWLVTGGWVVPWPGVAPVVT